ncbi:apelin receptor B-like [Archocentrus centrarchus]|uniref:apelin receptor B-like n=1 Tax=Archocentrus centrarchus TaxID=63155 RepID=UPI0011E9FCC1|nr:apelin receptor B-like [Archocentrus centrarchus]
MTQLNFTAFASNISSSSYPSWDSSGLVPALVLSICFLLGFPGNIAVIILKPNWENMSSLSQSLMLSLAASDLLYMLTIPVWIYSFLFNWTIGLVSCKLLTYFTYCSVYGSVLTVTSMSIQRYLQMVHLERRFHQEVPSGGYIRKRIVLLWLVVMILSIPAVVFRKVIKKQDWTTCSYEFNPETQRLGVLLPETIAGFVSVSVIVFVYISLYRKVNQAAFFNNPQTTRLISTISVIFFVLWVPYFIINVLGVAGISLKNEGLLNFYKDKWYIFTSLTFVNSALNPLLYAFMSNRLFTMCQKIAEHLVQKLRISRPQHIFSGRNVSLLIQVMSSVPADYRLPQLSKLGILKSRPRGIVQLVPLGVSKWH